MLAPPWHEFTTASRNMLLALLFAVLVVQSACTTRGVDGNLITRRKRVITSTSPMTSLEPKSPLKTPRLAALANVYVRASQVAATSSDSDEDTLSLSDVKEFPAGPVRKSAVSDLRNHSFADSLTSNTLDFDNYMVTEAYKQQETSFTDASAASSQNIDSNRMIDHWLTIELIVLELSAREEQRLFFAQILPLPYIPMTPSPNCSNMSTFFQLDKTWPGEPPRSTPMRLAALSAQKCLLHGILQNDSNLVLQAINRGADPSLPVYDDTQEMYTTYLTMAISLCNCTRFIVNVLIIAGAAVTNLDSAGMAPLHWACTVNSWRLADFFNHHDANMNIATGTGMRPIHVAARYKCWDTVIYLLNLDRVHVNDLDGTGNHFLFHVLDNLIKNFTLDDRKFLRKVMLHDRLSLTDAQAAEIGIQLVKENKFLLFKYYTGHLSLTARNLRALQHLVLCAVANRNMLVLEHLVTLRVSLNFVLETPEGRMLTPLLLAINGNNPPMLEYLLAHGANPGAVAVELHQQHSKVALQLLETNNHLLAIWYAIKINNVEAVRARVTACSRDDFTKIFVANETLFDAIQKSDCAEIAKIVETM